MLLAASPSFAGADEGEYITVHSYNHYKYRDDGKAGREIFVSYKGTDNITEGEIEIRSSGAVETVRFKTERPDSIPVLLPGNIGVSKTDTVVIGLSASGKKMYASAVIPKMRHWTVYIYPHSHVDIGYTNTQENVEFIHKRNLDVAMELAEKTASYPEDARFRWNPEVLWPVERYLASAPEDKREKLLDAIRNGQIVLDAGYLNTNTSAASDEELLELFRYRQEMKELTGTGIETMVQVDIPGMSWGIVPVAEQLGIKYCLSLFNGYGRIGNAYELNFKPFWWIGPDGKSKVLFLQPGSYNPGALVKGKYFWPQLAGQTDRSKLLRVVKTDNPRENFIDSYLADKLPMLEEDKDYIYDIFPMTWCMADNTPIDADLPDAVKSWNEEYAYPHLRICTGTEMMEAYADKYGDRIPQMTGDFTEFWTDGLGSSAKHSGKSREVKEKLVQSEILWSMLHPGKPAPENITREAWRHILLSTEHTWAYMQPEQEPICSEILSVKFGYFDKAEELADDVMDMTLEGIRSEDSGILAVYNTNSWGQTSLVTVDAETSAKYSSVLDENGEEVTSQKLSSGELVFVAENVPPLGKRVYTLSEKKGRKSSRMSKTSSDSYIIENGIVSVKVDPLTGDVVSLIYAGQEYVDSSAMTAVNSYRYLERDLTSGYAHKPYNVKVIRKECGPVVNSLLVTSDAKGVESLTREVRIVAGSPEVTFINTVDKIAIIDKEAVHFGFGFNVPGGKTMVNLPWSTMELEKEQFEVGNKNWIAVQRWVDVSNDEKGVTWCPLNAVCFESGDMTANIMDLAEFSPQWIRHLPESSIIYSWAMNNHWITNFPLSQEGTATFRYAVRPHEGGFDKVSANRFGMEQFRPLIAVQTTPEAVSGKVPGGITFSGAGNVYLSNYRTIENGHASILRFISLSDRDETISLDTGNRKVSSSHVIVEGLDDGSLEEVSLSSVIVPAKSGVTVKISWDE